MSGETGGARSIDEVVAALDEIVDSCRRQASRNGYFAALYRKVTVRVREGIAAGEFEDGSRMERLDVVFANRYLDAYQRYSRGEPPSASWRLAFDAARRWRPIVLQHLLLGMNAHINLDLGIAAARTAPGDELPALAGDFNKINDVLASLVDGVKQELSEVWPKLRRLDRLAGDREDAVINFSMSEARGRAWELARRLAPLDPGAQAREIARTDLKVALLGRLVRDPPPLTRLTTWLVRLGERGSVPEIVDLLS